MTVQDGFLPVYSVDTEEEARKLLMLSCPRNAQGEFMARELMNEQNLDNLWAFGDKLEKCHKFMQQKGTKAK